MPFDPSPPPPRHPGLQVRPPTRPPGPSYYDPQEELRMYGEAVRLRLWTWNPGAVIGYLTAWLVSGGRYGRLPFYRDYAPRELTPVRAELYRSGNLSCRPGSPIPPVADLRGGYSAVRGASAEEARPRPPRGGTGESGYVGPANVPPPRPYQIPKPLPPPTPPRRRDVR